MKYAALWVLMAALAACDGDFNMNSLAGKWQLATLNGLPAAAAKQEGAVSMEIFPDGKFAGQAPVNRYFGNIRVENNALKLGPVGSTMMAGPPALMDAEQDFFKALNNISSIDVENGKLIIRGADGMRLVFEKIE